MQLSLMGDEGANEYGLHANLWAQIKYSEVGFEEVGDDMDVLGLPGATDLDGLGDCAIQWVYYHIEAV